MSAALAGRPKMLLCALLVACSPQPPATLPDPDVAADLGDVHMLRWTTRADDGVLGHALEPGNLLRLDAQRKVIAGRSRSVPTDQTVDIVVSRESSADVAGGDGVFAASLRGTHATHVAYHVRITGYLEFAPDQLVYAMSSGCCLNGTVSPSCGDAFVTRLLRGTGTAAHLQRISGEAKVSATELLHAKGGSAFRKLSESSFIDAYFAFELASLPALCAKLPPESEVEPLSIAAPNNCFSSVIDSDGRRVSSAWHLPTADVCQQVAQQQCQRAKGSLFCQARFGSNGAGQELNVLLPTSPLPAGSAEPAPQRDRARAGRAAPSGNETPAPGVPANSATQPQKAPEGAAPPK